MAKNKTVCAIILLSAMLAPFIGAQQVSFPANNDLHDGSGSMKDGPEIWPSAAPGPFTVGYTVVHKYDRTRTFKPKYDYFGNPTAELISRPMQISVWYPADPIDNPQYMKLKEYYQTQATETDFTTPTEEQYKILLQHLKQVWPIEFRISPENREAIRTRIDSTFQKEVLAIRDAPPAAAVEW